MEETQQERTLTDADVEALLDKAFDRLRSNVGSAVLGLAWKGIVIALIYLAILGMRKGG